jgi:uncharacterized repeat protein (TIGR01451 family)
VTGVSPSRGPTAGGTSVTVTGSGFTGATAVDFGTVPAASFTVDSDTQITATSPARPAGPVDVTVTTPAGTSAAGAADQYTYTRIATAADISVALACPAAITVGSVGTCHLKVANAGPATATGVTAGILLPAELSLKSCTPGCTRQGSAYIWNLGPLAPGATATLVITVRAAAPGSALVLAAASARNRDPNPNPLNNITSARITIRR